MAHSVAMIDPASRSPHSFHDAQSRTTPARATYMPIRLSINNYVKEQKSKFTLGEHATNKVTPARCRVSRSSSFVNKSTDKGETEGLENLGANGRFVSRPAAPPPSRPSPARNRQFQQRKTGRNYCNSRSPAAGFWSSHSCTIHKHTRVTLTNFCRLLKDNFVRTKRWPVNGRCANRLGVRRVRKCRDTTRPAEWLGKPAEIITIHAYRPPDSDKLTAARFTNTLVSRWPAFPDL